MFSFGPKSPSRNSAMPIRTILDPVRYTIFFPPGTMVGIELESIGLDGTGSTRVKGFKFEDSHARELVQFLRTTISIGDIIYSIDNTLVEQMVLEQVLLLLKKQKEDSITIGFRAAPADARKWTCSSCSGDSRADSLSCDKCHAPRTSAALPPHSPARSRASDGPSSPGGAGYSTPPRKTDDGWYPGKFIGKSKPSPGFSWGDSPISNSNETIELLSSVRQSSSSLPMSRGLLSPLGGRSFDDYDSEMPDRDSSRLKQFNSSGGGGGGRGQGLSIHECYEVTRLHNHLCQVLYKYYSIYY